MNSDSIVTTAGKVIKRKKFTDNIFLDKMTGIYGTSGSGKSVSIKMIASKIKKYIDVAVVICPSERDKPSYAGCVPDALIYYEVYYPGPPSKNTKTEAKDGAVRLLQALWKFQSDRSNMYEEINKIEILKSLFNIISSRYTQEYLEQIDRIKDVLKNHLINIEKNKNLNPSQKEDKKKDLQAKMSEVIRALYKKAIYKNMDKIDERDLTEEQAVCLRGFAEPKPRMLIIMDDCAQDFKEFSKTQIFKSLFFRGRHLGITTLISIQSVTELDKNLRQNVHVNLFTTEQCALDYFVTQLKILKQKVCADITDTIFNADKSTKKIIYLKDDENKEFYYYYELEFLSSFRFCTDDIFELCAKLKKKETKISSSFLKLCKSGK